MSTGDFYPESGIPFKNVSPTGFMTTPPVYKPSLQTLIESLEANLALTAEDKIFLKEGLDKEKNKKDASLRIAFDTMLSVLEHQSPSILDKDSLAIYQQNRKIIKELLITVYNLTKQYDYDEKHSRLVLLGKVIQSLYESSK